MRRTHVPHPIGRAEFARRARRGRSRITEACKPGGPLERACLPDGTIDAASPAAVAWAEARGIEPASLLVDDGDAPAPAAAPCARRAAKTAPAGPEETHDAGASGPTAEDFTALSYRRRVAEVAELESRVDVRARRLISTEFVRQRVLGPVEDLFGRLLSDVVMSLSRTVGAAARAGASDIEIAATLRSAVSRELARAKRDMLRGLDHCDAGAHPPPVADEPLAPEDGLSQGPSVSDFAAAVTAELGTVATPAIVATIVKVTARAASTADVASLDRVLELQPTVISEATDTVSRMLAAHITRVRTRLTTEIPPNAEKDDPR